MRLEISKKPSITFKTKLTTYNQDKAKEFRKAFRQEYGTPSLPLQLSLIAEEASEVAEAGEALMTALAINDKFDRPDLIKFHSAALLKEVADTLVTCYQLCECMGWDLEVAHNRVHDSNMSKLGEDGKPIYDVRGKVLKGPNYQKPDLSDLV